MRHLADKPTRSIAALMIAVAVAGCILYFWPRWGQTWMPNIVVGALTVALTITVVEGAIRREGDLRRKPRRDDVLRHIGLGFNGLLHAIIIDYAGHHLDDFRPVPAAGIAMIDQWLANYESEDNEPRRGRRLNFSTRKLEAPSDAPLLLDEGIDFRNLLERRRDRDRDVIPEDLIHAIDRFGLSMGQAQMMFSMSVSDTDEDSIVRMRMCRRAVVEGARDLAEVIKRHEPTALTITELTQNAADGYNAHLRAQRDENR